MAGGEPRSWVSWSVAADADENDVDNAGNDWFTIAKRCTDPQTITDLTFNDYKLKSNWLTMIPEGYNGRSLLMERGLAIDN